MTVLLNQLAEADLDQTFAYYRSIEPKLGDRFVDEFRRAIERIIRFPRA